GTESPDHRDCISASDAPEWTLWNTTVCRV
ncbi:unnamed protein product, partial [Caretta caretta]